MTKKATFYNEICDALTKIYLDNLDKGNKSPWPFVSILDNDGRRMPYILTGKKELKPVSMEEMKARLLTRYRRSDRPITELEAEQVCKQWLLLIHPVKDIHTVAFSNEPDKWCYKRLDFSTKDRCEFPTWEEFIKNISNKDALCAFIGSIFFDDSSLQQYLWLHGEGMNGKSTLIRFIGKLLGQSFWTDDPEGLLGSRFGTSSLVGKRVCAFPDCNDKKFITSGKFKSLTGADEVRIENKGRQPYKIKLHTKFIVSSNEKPEVTDQKADMRRIIYCELPEIKEENIRSDFEDKLWKERSGFIDYCLMMYEDISDQLGRVRCSIEDVKKIAEENSMNDIFSLYCQRVFDINTDQNEGISGGEFKVVMDNLGIKNNQMISKFKKFVEDEYGIIRKKRNKRERWYPGLQIKDPKYLCLPKVRLEKVVTNIHEKNWIDKI